jgi:hypothetical protein
MGCKKMIEAPGATMAQQCRLGLPEGHDGPCASPDLPRSLKVRAQWEENHRDREAYEADRWHDEAARQQTEVSTLAAFQGPAETTAQRYTDNATPVPKSGDDEPLPPGTVRTRPPKYGTISACLACQDGRHDWCAALERNDDPQGPGRKECSCYTQAPDGHEAGERHPIMAVGENTTAPASSATAGTRPAKRTRTSCSACQDGQHQRCEELLTDGESPCVCFAIDPHMHERSHAAGMTVLTSELMPEDTIAVVVPTKQRPEDQRLPEVNDREYAQTLVVKDLEERLRLGISRYGTGLQPFNNRDTFRDLYEELLDTMVYLRALREERTEMAAKARVIVELLAPHLVGPRGPRIALEQVDKKVREIAEWLEQ